MSLVSRVQHPYVVEYKESWVEKVSTCSALMSPEPQLSPVSLYIITYYESHTWALYVVAGLLRLHCDGLLRRWRHVSLALLCLSHISCLLLLCLLQIFLLLETWLIVMLDRCNFWPDWVVMSTFGWVCFANTVHLVKAQSYQTLLASWEMHVTFLWLQGWRD